jgi:replicative superfamily II helicase
MPGEEYELMPERKLSSMKRELDDFRRKSENIDTKTGLPRETASSLENLNRSINSLLGMFKTATEELKLEERDEELISKQLDPIDKKIETLLDQNEKIAKAIIAIADMIKEKSGEEPVEAQKRFEEPRMKEEVPSFMPPPSRPMFPPPPPGGAPEPIPPFGMSELEPLPSFGEKPKKKGLFGFKK